MQGKTLENALSVRAHNVYYQNARDRFTTRQYKDRPTLYAKAIAATKDMDLFIAFLEEEE